MIRFHLPRPLDQILSLISIQLASALSNRGYPRLACRQPVQVRYPFLLISHSEYSQKSKQGSPLFRVFSVVQYIDTVIKGQTPPVLDRVEEIDSKKEEGPDLDSTTTDQDAFATTESTAFDTTEEMDDKRHRKTSKKIKRLPYRAQKSTESSEDPGLTIEQTSELLESVDTSRLLVFAVRTTRNQPIIDRIITMNGKNDKICIFDLVKGICVLVVHFSQLV